MQPVTCPRAQGNGQNPRCWKSRAVGAPGGFRGGHSAAGEGKLGCTPSLRRDSSLLATRTWTCCPLAHSTQVSRPTAGAKHPAPPLLGAQPRPLWADPADGTVRTSDVPTLELDVTGCRRPKDVTHTLGMTGWDSHTHGSIQREEITLAVDQRMFCTETLHLAFLIKNTLRSPDFAEGKNDLETECRKAPETIRKHYTKLQRQTHLW